MRRRARIFFVPNIGHTIELLLNYIILPRSFSSFNFFLLLFSIEIYQIVTTWNMYNYHILHVWD